ncbi:hypothetical protein ROS62_06245 [Streptomyces sp. DSM 41972]|uniref:Uncharacterized protein n=1 Tax=Streptomyces althioticus subsp. attaecolombicae TaxID=3075534 RepID=A0ABU3HUX6_9ACTN|nr:hypothetical protein [Streptomyces sp. DSM 41972]
MATQRTMTHSCWTCGSDQPHRLLTKKEEDWLKERLGRKGVSEFRLCVNVLDPDTGKQCRNLRTGFTEKPFAKPIKVPVPD